MRAVSLSLTNVRSHAESVLNEFSPKLNIFVGANGVGKTSVLEALSLTSVTKTFTSHTDSVLIRKGAQQLTIASHFESDLGVPLNVTVGVTPGPPLQKSINVNGERLRSASMLVGRCPVVILTPDDKGITSGGPAERRRFMSMVLSQASQTYLKEEVEYRTALRHRNAVLLRAKLEGRSLRSVEPILETWTELVIKHGSHIVARRAQFISEFQPYLTAGYELLSAHREQPTIVYHPSGRQPDDSDLSEILAREAERVATEEIRRGTTLFGPHRDELVLCINPEAEAKAYASQGQHKSLLVALKLAEFSYLQQATGETPILLLDDVFSELDTARANKLLEITVQSRFGQTFITSTNEQFFLASGCLQNSDNSLWLTKLVSNDGGAPCARIERVSVNA